MKNHFVKVLNKFLRSKKHKYNKDLINRYYDEIQKQDQQDPFAYLSEEMFDNREVYKRILEDIENKEKRRTLNRRVLSVAASVIMFLLLSVLGYRYRLNILNCIDPIAIVEKRAEKGEMLQMVLSDGTKVWLNADSRLLYPAKFRGEKREVTLVGEAYFEVVHQTGEPFIIHTGKLVTEVLGTSFNIRAYQDDQYMEVAVLTGKVGVMNAAKDAEPKQVVTFLTSNQEAVYHKSLQLIEKQAIDATLAASWKDGNFRFRNVSFMEVIKALERSYNVQIDYDKEVEKCIIYADFTREQSIDRILYMLASSLKGNMIRKGDKKYYINGGGCS